MAHAGCPPLWSVAEQKPPALVSPRGHGPSRVAFPPQASVPACRLLGEQGATETRGLVGSRGSQGPAPRSHPRTLAGVDPGNPGVSPRYAPLSTLDRLPRRCLHAHLLLPTAHGPSPPSVLLPWCLRAIPASCHPRWHSAAACPMKIQNHRDFPGRLVAKALHLPCRGPGFDPWSGN